MADVIDVAIWNQTISHFKDFAALMSAEFKCRRYPDGKEVVTVERWYNPNKESKNVKSAKPRS